MIQAFFNRLISQRDENVFVFECGKCGEQFPTFYKYPAKCPECSIKFDIIIIPLNAKSEKSKPQEMAPTTQSLV